MSNVRSFLDPAGLDAAVRECARITAPQITDAGFAKHREEQSESYRETFAQMERAVDAYLSAATPEPVVRAIERILQEKLPGVDVPPGTASRIALASTLAAIRLIDLEAGKVTADVAGEPA